MYFLSLMEISISTLVSKVVLNPCLLKFYDTNYSADQSDHINNELIMINNNQLPYAWQCSRPGWVGSWAIWSNGSVPAQNKGLEQGDL